MSGQNPAQQHPRRHRSRVLPEQTGTLPSPADYDRFIVRGVLAHPSVANAASNFALRQVKYTTEIPV